MPWLVSMRMIGHVIGAPPTTATRRSVILRSEGFEFVLMFCPSASIGSGAAARADRAIDPTPSAAMVLLRNDRRPSVVLSGAMGSLLSAFLTARGAPPPRALARGRRFATLPSGRSLGPQALLRSQSRLHHRPRVSDVERITCVSATAWILRLEVGAFAVVIDPSRVLRIDQAWVFLPDQLL